jgi:hypothetical protein
MREGFVIEKHPTCVGDSEDEPMIRKVFGFLPNYWQEVIPLNTRVVVTGKNLCAINECGRGLFAKIKEVKFDLVQASLVGDTVYAHYNNKLKNSDKIFQYELLVMFGYAMCNNPNFLSFLDDCFPNTKNKQEKFANSFPSILTEKRRDKMRLEKPNLFKCMIKLEDAVKKL